MLKVRSLVVRNLVKLALLSIIPLVPVPVSFGQTPTADAGELHFVALGIDAEANSLRGNANKLGSDVTALNHSVQDANVADTHILIDEDSEVKSGDDVPRFIDALRQLKPTLKSSDTLLVVVAARGYGETTVGDKGAYADILELDLDKFGHDFSLMQLLVALRRLPCSNVLLVLPAIESGTESVVRSSLHSLPSGEGAQNITIAMSQSVIEGRSPMLAALGNGLRGDADSNGDGVITSDEIINFLRATAKKSQPTALDLADPAFHSWNQWEIAAASVGKAFPVLSREIQAKIVGQGSSQPATTESLSTSAPPLVANVAPSGHFRGTTPEFAAKSAPAVKLPKTYALLFAVDNYDQGWPTLTNPIFDAQALQAKLRDTYDVSAEVFTDPTADNVISTLRKWIARSYGSDDQIIVFFAGHGYFDDTFKLGYFATRDSKLPAADESHRTMLSFDEIRRLVGDIPAQHVLLLVDSCFSGTFDRRLADSGTRDVDSLQIYAPKPLLQVLSQQSSYPTRRFITSGGKEYVPDGCSGCHSPFTQALLQTLEHDATEHGYTRWRDLQNGLESVDPSPRWGSFDSRDDLNGDLILLTPAMRTKLLTTAAQELNSSANRIKVTK